MTSRSTMPEREDSRYVLFTIEEVSARLGRSQRWLLEWLRQHPRDRHGEPFYSKRGRSKLFNNDDLMRIRAAVTGRSPFSELSGMLTKLPDDLATPPVPAQKAEGRIYFIDGGDFIKIGFTRSPRARFVKMLTDSPLELKLLHIEPGSFKTEKIIHRHFASLRARGEWFRKDAALLDYIAQRKLLCPP